MIFLEILYLLLVSLKLIFKIKVLDFLLYSVQGLPIELFECENELCK